MLRNFGQPGRRASGTIALVAMLSLAACQDDNSGLLVDPGAAPSAAASGSFLASQLGASVGSEVTVALSTDPVPGTTFGGLQGTMLYDHRLLEFVGQVPANGTMVVINASEAGRIRLQALNVRGLGETPAIFTFRVKGGGWENSLDFHAEHFVDVDMREHSLRFTRGYVRGGDLPSASAARSMSDGDWVEYLDPTLAASLGGPQAIDSWGGQDNDDIFLHRACRSVTWGDGVGGTCPPNAGNGIVNVLDNVYTANLSVGNSAVSECILESAQRGDCNAINVHPANLPGIGGPQDDCPPGLDSCAANARTRTINVLDNLEIALRSTGSVRPVAGLAMVFTSGAAGDGSITLPDSILCSSGQRVITGALNLTNNRIWRVNKCRLSIGSELAAADSGTLNIEAGTVIMSDSGSIDITRNGRIFANGTWTQPIMMTCPAQPAGNERQAGCWGGLQIVGNANINEITGGSATSTNANATRRGATSGTGQKPLEGFIPADLFYGGGNDDDNSGTLRHVIIAYGGRSVGANNELNNLTIGACGRNTTLEYIQTHGGSDDGLEIFGGRCNVRGLVSTLNDDDQFDVSFGYDGDSQYMFIRCGVQHAADPGPVNSTNTDTCFEWDNSENSGTYANTPMTTPTIWNLTVVGGNATTTQPDKFANIRRGAGGHIANAIVLNVRDGFDIDNDESCSRLGTTLTFHGAFLGVTNSAVAGSPGACTAAVVDAYLDGLKTLSPPQFFEGAYAGQMRDPFAYTVNYGTTPDRHPDIRCTVANCGTGVTPIAVPARPFFDAGGGSFLGAAAPGSGAIPFYSGWAIWAEGIDNR